MHADAADFAALLEPFVADPAPLLALLGAEGGPDLAARAAALLAAQREPADSSDGGPELTAVDPRLATDALSLAVGRPFPPRRCAHATTIQSN